MHLGDGSFPALVCVGGVGLGSPADLSVSLGLNSFASACKILNKTLNFSEPRVPHLQHGGNEPHSHGVLRALQVTVQAVSGTGLVPGR